MRTTSDQAVTVVKAKRSRVHFRRWKLAILVIALIGVTRIWWGWEANRRLQRRLGAIAALGEPLSIRDPMFINRPSISSSQNGATYYNRIFPLQNLSVGSPSSGSLMFRSYPPYPPSWQKEADAAVAAHGPVYPLARQARNAPSVDFGIPAPGSFPAYYNSARFLANLLTDTALRSHVSGDDATTVELLRDSEAIGAALETDDTVVGQLVASGCYALVTSRIMIMAPALTIAPTDAPPLAGSVGTLLPAMTITRQPARREQVEALILSLLDERKSVRGARRALLRERANMLDDRGNTVDGSWLLRPMFNADCAHSLDVQAAALRALDQPDFPAAKQVYGVWPTRSVRSSGPFAFMFPTTGPRPRPERIRYEYLFSSFFPDDGELRFIDQIHRARLERRMAALSLAVRLYRADHADGFPAVLGDLVPKYLPAVPLDPFTTGAPLKYLTIAKGRPDGADRRVIYSVGEDCIDNNANGQAVPAEPEYDWTQTSDQVRDLTRWTPAGPLPDDGATPPPTTVPAPEDDSQ